MAALVWVQSVCVCVSESRCYLMCFLLFAGSELPQHKTCTWRPTHQQSTHTHTKTVTHTGIHTKSHPLTHTDIHTHALYALTPKLLQCTTERLAVGQSDVETNKHTYKLIYSERESERALPRESAAAESNDWEWERESQSPLTPHIHSQATTLLSCHCWYFVFSSWTFVVQCV